MKFRPNRAYQSIYCRMLAAVEHTHTNTATIIGNGKQKYLHIDLAIFIFSQPFWVELAYKNKTRGDKERERVEALVYQLLEI